MREIVSKLLLALALLLILMCAAWLAADALRAAAFNATRPSSPKMEPSERGIWLGVIGLGVFVLAGVLRLPDLGMHILWLRMRGGRCPRCRYSMEGLPTARCPECGWPEKQRRPS